MTARLAGLLAALLLAGCDPKVRTVTIKRDTLVAPAATQVVLRCPTRLKAVVDGRPGSDAGGLGWKQLQIEDAPGIVRAQLLAGGLQPADAPSGRDVVVTLKQLYLGQNHMTKNPVVVYSVALDGWEPFLVRAQPTYNNWADGEGEVRSSVSRALAQANAQVIEGLEKRCR